MNCNYVIEEALIRTASVYTPTPLLDQLIARGWGDTPRDRIPTTWRKRWGPGKRTRTRKPRAPRTYLAAHDRSAIKAGRRLTEKPGNRVQSTLDRVKRGVGSISTVQQVAGHPHDERRASK